jgi:hypothetical protein
MNGRSTQLPGPCDDWSGRSADWLTARFHVKPRGVAGLINNASELFAHLILSMILKLSVQKYIVRHLTMGAAR